MIAQRLFPALTHHSCWYFVCDAMASPPVIRADLLASEWTDIIDTLLFKALAHDSWGIYGPVIHGPLQHEEDPQAAAQAGPTYSAVQTRYAVEQ